MVLTLPRRYPYPSSSPLHHVASLLPIFFFERERHEREEKAAEQERVAVGALEGWPNEAWKGSFPTTYAGEELCRSNLHVKAVLLGEQEQRRLNLAQDAGACLP